MVTVEAKTWRSGAQQTNSWLTSGQMTRGFVAVSPGHVVVRHIG
jgi:hypothetical protein